jgi:transcription initiation factor TFIIB
LSRDRRSNRAKVGIDLGELKQFSEKLSVPDAVNDEAARIYTRSLERGLEKGRSFAQITASSLYAACRERGVPTTLNGMAAATGVRRDEIAKCYRLLVNELNMEIPVADPAEYLARLASRLKVSPKAEADATEIVSRARKAGISAGKDPIGLAATAIYLAALLDGQNMTQAGAAEAAGVTEATVRNQSKRLKKIPDVQPGRTPRKRRPNWYEWEITRSAGAQVPARSLARGNEPIREKLT